MTETEKELIIAESKKSADKQWYEMFMVLFLFIGAGCGCGAWINIVDGKSWILWLIGMLLSFTVVWKFSSKVYGN